MSPRTSPIFLKALQRKKDLEIPIQYQRDQPVKKNYLFLARHQNISHKFIVVQLIIKEKSFGWVWDFLVPRVVIDSEMPGIVENASQTTAEGTLMVFTV